MIRAGGCGTFDLAETNIMRDLQIPLLPTRMIMFGVGQGGVHLINIDAGISWVPDVNGGLNDRQAIVSIDALTSMAQCKSGTVYHKAGIGRTRSLCRTDLI